MLVVVKNGINWIIENCHDSNWSLHFFHKRYIICKFIHDEKLHLIAFRNALFLCVAFKMRQLKNFYKNYIPSTQWLRSSRICSTVTLDSHAYEFQMMMYDGSVKRKRVVFNQLCLLARVHESCLF